MKKSYLLTPGPTPVPPEVALETAKPILHHRTKEFSQIFVSASEGLKYIFQTTNDVFIITSSGSGAMESAVVNLLSPGDKAIVVQCGVFGNRWEKILTSYGITVVNVKVEMGETINPQDVEKTLAANPDTKAVFTTHTETSTGVAPDIKIIGEIIAKTPAVLVVDAVSGLGGQELRMDEWKLDVVVSGSQKGLMNAPGLAFASVSAKAWKLVESSKLPKFYFDYKSMKTSLSKNTTPFTPAVTLVIGLGKAVEMIKSEGIENLWKRHIKLAEGTRAAVKALGLELFAKRPCNVVTSIKSPAGIDSEQLVNMLLKEYGVSIAEGQQNLKGKIFRIAHMGYMNEFDIIVGIAAIERGLMKLGYTNFKYGDGVGAAEKVLFE
ncbi:MAG: alanine--glyoxylate aminotransferase family protein [Elusimicrobiota bacterium]